MELYVAIALGVCTICALCVLIALLARQRRALSALSRELEAQRALIADARRAADEKLDRLESHTALLRQSMDWSVAAVRSLGMREEVMESPLAQASRYIAEPLSAQEAVRTQLNLLLQDRRFTSYASVLSPPAGMRLMAVSPLEDLFSRRVKAEDVRFHLAEDAQCDGALAALWDEQAGVCYLFPNRAAFSDRYDPAFCFEGAATARRIRQLLSFAVLAMDEGGAWKLLRLGAVEMDSL